MSKKCQNCGAEMADDMNFCPQCHAKYEAPVSAGPTPVQPQPEASNAAPSQAPKVELPLWAKLWQKRMTRKDFWILQLIIVPVNIILNFIPFVGQVLGLVVTFVDLSFCGARLQDAGKSSWNLLWYFLPIAGPIILIIFYCQPSQKGENAWGPESQRIF